MVSKAEFDRIASEISCDVNTMMAKMQSYKKYLQYEILEYATTEELIDVKYSKYNNNLVKKLIVLAGEEYFDDGGGLKSLYSASMAVATIIKEYGWGTKFLTPDGLYEMANLISNSLLHHSDVLNDGNLKMKNIAYEIELYTRFLGLTEEEINNVGFMGVPIRMLKKISYPYNMVGIAMIITQTQKFLLFIDNDYGRRVVTQRTYWGKDINTAYELFANDKTLIIDGKPKYFDTDGYMIKSSKFNRILVERGIDDNEQYIVTSINV